MCIRDRSNFVSAETRYQLCHTTNRRPQSSCFSAYRVLHSPNNRQQQILHPCMKLTPTACRLFGIRKTELAIYLFIYCFLFTIGIEIMSIWYDMLFNGHSHKCQFSLQSSAGYVGFAGKKVPGSGPYLFLFCE